MGSFIRSFLERRRWRKWCTAVCTLPEVGGEVGMLMTLTTTATTLLKLEDISKLTILDCRRCVYVPISENATELITQIARIKRGYRNDGSWAERKFLTSTNQTSIDRWLVDSKGNMLDLEETYIKITEEIVGLLSMIDDDSRSYAERRLGTVFDCYNAMVVLLGELIHA